MSRLPGATFSRPTGTTLSYPTGAILSRRSCVATGVAALSCLPVSTPAIAAPPKLPVPDSGRLAFRLVRNGDVIGSHTLDFATVGDTLSVSVGIDILVKLGPVPVYRYAHRATETWRAGIFTGIESTTNRDGTPHHMRAETTANGLTVEGSGTLRYQAPANILATTYWNKAMLQPKIINSEDGRLFDVTSTALAEETVAAASGTLRARHYKLDGDLPLDLWYDDTAQWAHLVFTKDGSTVTYEKL
jgi:hypothetical protein